MLPQFSIYSTNTWFISLLRVEFVGNQGIVAPLALTLFENELYNLGQSNDRALTLTASNILPPIMFSAAKSFPVINLTLLSRLSRIEL